MESSRRRRRPVRRTHACSAFIGAGAPGASDTLWRLLGYGSFYDSGRNDYHSRRMSTERLLRRASLPCVGQSELAQLCECVDKTYAHIDFGGRLGDGAACRSHSHADLARNAVSRCPVRRHRGRLRRCTADSGIDPRNSRDHPIYHSARDLGGRSDHLAGRPRAGMAEMRGTMPCPTISRAIST